MNKDLRNRIVVAASAAKVAGFDGTYLALLELLISMQQEEDDPTSPLDHAAILQQIHS